MVRQADMKHLYGWWWQIDAHCDGVESMAMFVRRRRNVTNETVAGR